MEVRTEQRFSMNILKKAAYLATLLLSVTLLASCATSGTAQWTPGKPLDKASVRIGVIYLDEAESGWSYAHELGIRKVQREFGMQDDQIIRKFNVSEADIAMIEYMISEAIAEGANIIIAPSWGFMDACQRMADEHPNVVFAHASGYKSNDTNFTNYFGRLYQARYLAGIAAGLRTETGKVGFVAAQGITNSEVTGGLNAFAIGVESVNPDAQIYVSVTHSWFDPAGERRAAQRLIDEGCDVIAQHCDTVEPQIAASQAGVWGIGNNVDMSSYAPGAVLTSVIWDWGNYYTLLIGSIIDGSFTTQPYFGGLSDGMVDLSPLNHNLATPGMEELIAGARERIINEGFGIFQGEMKTNDGRIIGTAGETLPDSEKIGGINWYYHNIIVLH